MEGCPAHARRAALCRITGFTENPHSRHRIFMATTGKNRNRAYPVIEVEMNSSLFPMWVQVLQALALLLIGVVGACIAWQQMHVAWAKLQHDLYERRHAVFQAALEILSEVQSHPRENSKDLYEKLHRSFALCVVDSHFIFQDDLVNYLEKTRDQVTKFRRNTEYQKYYQWLDQELVNLRDRFRHVLDLEKRTTQLNVPRGLFRLWLAVSLVWIIIVMGIFLRNYALDKG
jgi:hypothetical protein